VDGDDGAAGAADGVGQVVGEPGEDAAGGI
jgi:hypothetical protein